MVKRKPIITFLLIISITAFSSIAFEGLIFPAIFESTNSVMLEIKEKEKNASAILNAIMEESGFENYSVAVDYEYDSEYMTNGYHASIKATHNEQLDYVSFHKTLSEIFLDPFHAEESDYYIQVFQLTYNGQTDTYTFYDGTSHGGNDTIHAKEMNATITYDKSTDTYSIDRPLKGMPVGEIYETGYGKPLFINETDEGMVYRYQPFSKTIDYIIQNGVVASIKKDEV